MARLLILSAVWLFSGAFVCSKQPVASISSHPPAADLTCRAEPAALTDEQVIADEHVYQSNPALGHPYQDAFDLGQIIAGRTCRDALRRACQWHKDRGYKEVDCDKPQG